MKNTTTIVPIHPPKFNYGLEILQSFEKYMDGDLWFVFSTIEDYFSFKSLSNKDILGFVIPPHMIGANTNIINAKKFYGISEAFRMGYKYVAVLDSEAEFVKSFDTDVVYKEIFESKTFKANNSKNTEYGSGGFVTYETALALGLENNFILKTKTKDFNLYWWFNELCVYERDTFNEFYVWYVSHPNYNKIKTLPYTFDFMMYSIWLVAFKGFDIKVYMDDMVFITGCIETNFFNNNISNIYKSYADCNKNNKDIEHIKIIIHKDRI